jgi:hypothetical protein
MSLRIVINSFDVDYGKESDLRMSLNYSIADINQIGDKATQGSRSYTIKLPATATNKKVFGYTEDITVTNGFDHTLEYDCFVELDGSVVINGAARIKAALNNNRSIDSYQITILGDNSTWINDFRALSLTDLDFSDQTHTYDKATITASETLNDTRHYIYPLINYGNFGIENGNKSVLIGDRFPAIRVREYIKRMFSDQGYKIVSDFIDSDFFGRLFMAFSGKNYDEVLSAEFRNLRLFRASLDGASVTVGASSSKVINFNNDSTLGNFDNGGFYTSGVYTVDTPTVQEFIFNFDYSVNLSTRIVQKVLGVVISDITFPQNNITDYSKTKVFIQQNTGSGWFNVVNAENVTPSDKISTGFLNVSAGDQFRCVVSTGEPTVNVVTDDVTTITTTRTYSTVVLPTATIFYNNVERYYAEGSDVDLTNYVPDLNQLDYFADLRDQYNWHVVTDYNRKIVYIEPRDTFFRGQALDYTDKLNLDKGINIGFMGANLSRSLTLKYAEDNDDVQLKKFKEDNERSFASESVEILNVNAREGEAFKSTKVTAATIMSSAGGINLKNTEIPTLLDSFEEPKLRTSYIPRILYYEGVQDLNAGDTWDWSGTTRTDYPKLTFGDVTSSGSPLLSFNDNGTIGLFQKYHRNTYNTINNSRIITVEMLLSAADIESFDFRNPIYTDIQGEVTYYHVNKIENYNPLGSGLTKVELIKVINPVPQAQENIPVSTLPPNEIPQPPVIRDLLTNINGITTTVKYTDNGGNTVNVKFQ